MVTTRLCQDVVDLSEELQEARRREPESRRGRKKGCQGEEAARDTSSVGRSLVCARAGKEASVLVHTHTHACAHVLPGHCGQGQPRVLSPHTQPLPQEAASPPPLAPPASRSSLSPPNPWHVPLEQPYPPKCQAHPAPSPPRNLPGLPLPWRSGRTSAACSQQRQLHPASPTHMTQWSPCQTQAGRQAPLSPGGPCVQAEKEPASPRKSSLTAPGHNDPSLGTCRDLLGMAHLPRAVSWALTSGLLSVLHDLSPTPSPRRHSFTKHSLGKVHEAGPQKPPQVTRQGCPVGEGHQVHARPCCTLVLCPKPALAPLWASVSSPVN